MIVVDLCTTSVSQLRSMSTPKLLMYDDCISADKSLVDQPNVPDSDCLFRFVQDGAFDVVNDAEPAF